MRDKPRSNCNPFTPYTKRNTTEQTRTVYLDPSVRETNAARNKPSRLS